MGELEPIPADVRQGTGHTLNRSPSIAGLTQGDRLPDMLTLTPMGN